MDFGIARSTAMPRHAQPGARPGIPAPPSAAAHHAATTVGTIVGTVEYMAPEQASGQPVDQRADIYAFGLILYDILLGRRRAGPATAPSRNCSAGWRRRLRRCRRSRRTSAALAALMARCVEPDPAKRFQTSADVAAELERLDADGHLIPVKRVVRLPYAIAAAVVARRDVGRRVVVSAPVHPAGDTRSDQGRDRRFRERAPTTRHSTAPSNPSSGACSKARHSSARTIGSRIGGLGVQAPEHLDEASALLLAVKQGVGAVVSGSVVPQRRRISSRPRKRLAPRPRDVIATQSADAARQGRGPRSRHTLDGSHSHGARRRHAGIGPAVCHAECVSEFARAGPVTTRPRSKRSHGDNSRTPGTAI